MVLSRTELMLTKTFLLIRISLYFFVLPCLRSIWSRMPLAPFAKETDSLFGMLWKNLSVFDSTQLAYVAATSREHGGYVAEQNHAFYPMFPWIANSIATAFGDDHFIYVGPLLSLIQSYLNTILLYRVGVLVYKDSKMAELAAYLYIASHSVLYQITFYSENTFLLFTLLGFYAMYAGKRISQSSRGFGIPSTSYALLACFFFGMSTLTRSTGVLLSIFIAFFVGNAILIRSDRCLATARSIFVALICIAIMFAPLLIIVYWRPHLLHCGLRFDREWRGTFPEWCIDDVPNVYTYI